MTIKGLQDHAPNVWYDNKSSVGLKLVRLESRMKKGGSDPKKGEKVHQVSVLIEQGPDTGETERPR